MKRIYIFFFLLIFRCGANRRFSLYCCFVFLPYLFYDCIPKTNESQVTTASCRFSLACCFVSNISFEILINKINDRIVLNMHKINEIIRTFVFLSTEVWACLAPAKLITISGQIEIPHREFLMKKTYQKSLAHGRMLRSELISVFDYIPQNTHNLMIQLSN